MQQDDRPAERGAVALEGYVEDTGTDHTRLSHDSHALRARLPFSG